MIRQLLQVNQRFAVIREEQAWTLPAPRWVLEESYVVASDAEGGSE